MGYRSWLLSGELVKADAHAEATTIRRGLGMALKRFLVTVEGPNLKDVSEAELLELPEAGQTSETRFGACIIARAARSPERMQYTSKLTFPPALTTGRAPWRGAT